MFLHVFSYLGHYFWFRGFFLCCLFIWSLAVGTSTTDGLQRLLSKVTYYVLCQTSCKTLLSHLPGFV